MNGYRALALGLGVLAAGCMPPRRASTMELQGRAIFDLGCPGQQIQLIPLGPRTRAVSGCGRRLTYVERCDPALGAEEACAWMLDTPSFVQGQWPQTIETQILAAQQYAQQRQPWPAPPPAPATANAANDTPPPSGDARRDPLGIPPPPRGRKLPTTLFDGQSKPPPPKVPF